MIYKMQRLEFNNKSGEIQPFRSLNTSGSRLFKAEWRAQDRTRDVCSFCCGKLSTVLHLPDPRWSWVPTAGQVLSGSITMLTLSIEADLNSASEARCVNLREKKRRRETNPCSQLTENLVESLIRKTANEGEKGTKTEAPEVWDTHCNTTTAVFGNNSRPNIF